MSDRANTPPSQKGQHTMLQAVENGLAGEATEYGQSPMLSRTASQELTLNDTHNSAEKIDGKDVEKAGEPEDTGLLTGARLYLVFLSLMLSVFVSRNHHARNQSIVSTAIPQIVSEFQAFDQVSWIITGYFLTQCGLILLVGQLLTVLKAKWMLLGAVFFFELGSLICAVAKDMTTLIGGRAVQGIGASGMFVSILAVIAVVTRVDQRAAFMASFGIVFVISSVVGPLLGGVFTERVSWRWCFWINLPFGGVAAAAVVFLLPARDPAVNVNTPHDRTLLGKLKRMDWVGTALIFLTITCLLLALAWGGNQYPWKSAMFFFMLAMLGGTYQLPLFYQAGRGHSPEKSGIDIIAFMLSICVAIFISGGVTTKTGRYYYFLLIG
ncbi:uncharacterized protein IL334_001219 [Kwoniella shivajii]|uniref:Major facilitator superfamily (MFS) profile domain-containing protein n=1 Tax=Kwoniella shivajii TaxID=564305 RepID=A0ABZ1CRX7_9TREE|nr:hypothetical protein IL334_001219 [Kwoniella shivajii]